MILIINSGMGNLGSIFNIFQKIDHEVKISSDADDIINADKIILPGVGAFDKGMENLQKLDIITLLNEKVIDENTPILGICLGMQLFSKKSEEGVSSGLNWIDCETIRFNFESNAPELNVPHIGWNTLNEKQLSNIITGIGKDAKFYFVHSYHITNIDPKNVIATTVYGYEFPSIIKQDNITGIQFHPEKSHKYGLKILKNFAESSP